MGLSAAKQAAKVLLSLLSIADPDLALRRACAYTKLSVTVLRDAQWQGAKGNWTPLEERVRSLELQGVAPEMARRICWDALAILQGIVSGSCVTPAADCGVRRVLSRRRNSSQLGDQPKSGTRDIIVYYCPDSVGRA